MQWIIACSSFDLSLYMHLRSFSYEFSPTIKLKTFIKSYTFEMATRNKLKTQINSSNLLPVNFSFTILHSKSFRALFDRRWSNFHAFCWILCFLCKIKWQFLCQCFLMITLLALRTLGYLKVNGVLEIFILNGYVNL